MEKDETELSIDDLAARVGMSPRNIRFYIARDLLSGPGTRGKAAAYGEEHLVRLQLIRRLTESRVPLEEIGKRLAGLSLDEMRVLLAEEDRRESELRVAEQAPSPKEYVSALLRRAQAARQQPLASPAPLPSGAIGAPLPVSSPSPVRPTLARVEDWQRWELVPGVELHVRGDATHPQRGLIARLRAVAESSD